MDAKRKISLSSEPLPAQPLSAQPLLQPPDRRPKMTRIFKLLPDSEQGLATLETTPSPLFSSSLGLASNPTRTSVAFKDSGLSRDAYDVDKRQIAAQAFGGSAFVKPFPATWEQVPKSSTNPFSGPVTNSNLFFGSSAANPCSSSSVLGLENHQKTPLAEDDTSQRTKVEDTTFEENIDADLDMLCRPSRAARIGPSPEHLSRLTAEITTLKDELKCLREENGKLRSAFDKERQTTAAALEQQDARMRKIVAWMKSFQETKG